MLQSGQILIGDEANKGDGTTPTLIVGHGDTGLERWSATIIGSEGSRISGLKIGENTYIVLHFAVWIDGITVKVSENTFNRNTYGGVKIMNNGTSVIEKNVFNTNSYGVYLYYSSDGGTIQNNSFTSPALPIDIVLPGTYAVIRDNTITGNGQVGIQVQHGNPLIQNNTFNKTTGYGYGAIRAQFSDAEPTVRKNDFICTKAVVITDGNPDLGTASEAGNNDFLSVTGASVTHEGSATITAIGNTWPNSPPGCRTDIVVTGSGSVVWGTPDLQCP